MFTQPAFWTRLFPDIFGQLGWIDFFNVAQRKKVIAILAWIFPMLWACAYLFIELPVLMVLSGGVVGSCLLFIVVFGAYHFKYTRTQLVPSGTFYISLLMRDFNFRCWCVWRVSWWGILPNVETLPES